MFPWPRLHTYVASVSVNSLLHHMNNHLRCQTWFGAYSSSRSSINALSASSSWSSSSLQRVNKNLRCLKGLTHISSSSSASSSMYERLTCLITPGQTTALMVIKHQHTLLDAAHGETTPPWLSFAQFLCRLLLCYIKVNMMVIMRT